LPPPPGNASVTAHLPALSGPACSLTTPSIQDGQVFVANAPCLNPLFHSGLNATSFAVWPLFPAAVTLSQFRLMSLLDSMASLSSLPMYPVSSWFCIALKICDVESNHGLPVACTYFAPAAK